MCFHDCRYGADFGDTNEAIMLWCAPHLPTQVCNAMTTVISRPDWKLKYAPYDWSQNATAPTAKTVSSGHLKTPLLAQRGAGPS